MIISILSFLIIVGRAYLSFQDRIAHVIGLDILSLSLFVVLVIFKRDSIYAGIIAFLPSVSLYFFIQNKPISDLLFVSLLLTVSILFHGRSSSTHLINKESSLKYFFILYLTLLLMYLITNYLNLYLDRSLQPVFLRYLNYLVLTIYASYAFLMVYRVEEKDALAKAFIVGAVAYMTAAAMGYFYIEMLDMAEYADDITKELFRYPGFSNSNYIGNAILVMVAIAYTIKRQRLYLYSLLILFTAFLSQSRSVFFSGVLFLSYCVMHGIIQERRLRVVAKFIIAAIVSAASIFFIVRADEKLLDIAVQYVERVSLRTATENITERIDVIRSSVHEATDSYKNLLLGAGYVKDGSNPHNSIIQTLLLFGFVATLAVLSYFLYVSWKHPLLIFALSASLVEILFFTFCYDFLFFILLAVNVCHPAGLRVERFEENTGIPGRANVPMAAPSAATSLKR